MTYFWDHSNKIITLDHVIGLRSCGLILYGTLPANLAILGLIKVDIVEINKILPLLFPVSLLPLLLTFLLIRNRNKEWYLTTDFLNIRSAINTVLILLFASLICGASGIIKNKFDIDLTNIFNRSHLGPLAESFLMGIGSLVITSTLFMAILTKNTYLPGLPASSFIDLITTIRGKLRMIQASPIWREYNAQEIDKITEDVKAVSIDLNEDLGKAVSHPGNKLAKESLKFISLYLRNFQEAITAMDPNVRTA